MNEYYQILESTPALSLEDIKKNYHRLAHKHHPDKGGSLEVMKRVNSAWAWMQNNHRQGSVGAGNSYTYVDFSKTWSAGRMPSLEEMVAAFEKAQAEMQQQQQDMRYDFFAKKKWYDPNDMTS